MDFARGDTTTKLKVLRDVAEEGDGHEDLVQAGPRDLHRSRSIGYDTLAMRLRELSFLNKGVMITLTDERAGQEKSETFLAKGGLREFVAAPERVTQAAAHRGRVRRHDARRRRHRARDAVQRRLQRERLLVRQQHQHARRRHAPHRLQVGADARRSTRTRRRATSSRRPTSRCRATTFAKASPRCCR